jgi:hypothetical protein
MTRIAKQHAANERRRRGNPEVRERYLVAQREYYWRKKAAKTMAEEALFDVAPVQRVVPAHECESLSPRGPASVFHLADI